MSVYYLAVFSLHFQDSFWNLQACQRLVYTRTSAHRKETHSSILLPQARRRTLSISSRLSDRTDSEKFQSLSQWLVFFVFAAREISVRYTEIKRTKYTYLLQVQSQKWGISIQEHHKNRTAPL